MKPKYLWMRPLLGFIITMAVVLLTGYLTFKAFSIGWEKLPKEMLVLYVALVQALILSHKDSHGFYFGTSQGSANKSETLDTLINQPRAPEIE